MNEMRRSLIFVFMCVILFAAAARAGGDRPIHEHWAPVLMQSASTDADFITAADYDGDWIGNNNWQNFDKFPKKAVLYYDVKETATHWFIFYTVFHPRDYVEDPACPRSCHENDAESIQLTVRKDGSPHGRLEIMQTLAHGGITMYTNDPAVQGGAMEISGPITLTNGHPTAYIEEYGHGIYGTTHESLSATPVLTQIVSYVPKGKAEEPEGIPDKAVGYALVSIYDTFWQHRDCMGQGKCFDAPFEYRGAVLPAQIDGDDYGTDSANTPWGYNQATGGDIVRGDWFFDPAAAVLYHAGPLDDFSLEYVSNPYLADIAAMAQEK